MIRLAFGYISISFIAPLLGLLAYSGGNLFVTGLMVLPLVVTTFAFLWLVLEVARRDSLLSRSQFLKASVLCGISALLMVAASTELLVHFAPSINLGAALSDFRMFYFVYMMAIPTLIYTAVVGSAFWAIAIRGNPYVTAQAASQRKSGAAFGWIKLPRSKPSTSTSSDVKKAA